MLFTVFIRIPKNNIPNRVWKWHWLLLEDLHWVHRNRKNNQFPDYMSVSVLWLAEPARSSSYASFLPRELSRVSPFGFFDVTMEITRGKFHLGYNSKIGYTKKSSYPRVTNDFPEAKSSSVTIAIIISSSSGSHYY